MRRWTRRRPRQRATPADVFQHKLRAATQRGDELLRKALPQLAQQPEQRNRILAVLIVAGTAAAFGAAWLIGNWVTAQFPPPPLLIR